MYTLPGFLCFFVLNVPLPAHPPVCGQGGWESFWRGKGWLVWMRSYGLLCLRCIGLLCMNE